MLGNALMPKGNMGLVMAVATRLCVIMNFLDKVINIEATNAKQGD